MPGQKFPPRKPCQNSSRSGKTQDLLEREVLGRKAWARLGVSAACCRVRERDVDQVRISAQSGQVGGGVPRRRYGTRPSGRGIPPFCAIAAIVSMPASK